MDSIRSRCLGLLKTKIVRLLLVCLASFFLVLLLAGASVTKFLVIIQDENNTTIVYTSKSQPTEILASQNITLDENDSYDFTGFSDDKKASITINRAKEINIKSDDTVNTVYLTQGSVLDALNLANITVKDDDLINVALDENVVDKMNVVINRVEKKEIVVQSEVPYTINKIPTPLLKNGKTYTKVAGKNGTKEKKTVQTLIDGEVVEEQIIYNDVIKNPSPATVLVGDSKASVSVLKPKQNIVLDSKGNPINYKSKIVGKATAYSALGRKTSLKQGNVAMDLSRFPKGTKLYIKTQDGSFVYGYSEVKDTGTAVADGRILVDLFFNSYKESCFFGAKIVEIYVL